VRVLGCVFKICETQSPCVSLLSRSHAPSNFETNQPESDTEGQSEWAIGRAAYLGRQFLILLVPNSGMLKILFHADTLKVLGVHAIGERATEIIHIGQTALALDDTIEFFRDSVFNYPTFAEAYKVAALNGPNKL
jgi:NAD(P) transhydrogenase